MVLFLFQKVRTDLIAPKPQLDEDKQKSVLTNAEVSRLVLRPLVQVVRHAKRQLIASAPLRGLFCLH
nr:MAG TPA: hypothetical protein [Bacteriophage sp.]